MTADPGDRLRQTRDYYDRTTDLYIRYFGTTLQAGLVRSDGSEDVASLLRNHNLFLGQRARIREGDSVLDAGCGVCGPSIDLASSLRKIIVHCVTISPVQAQTARRHIQDAGLASRIQVCVGDFHRLPYERESFDVALFLESAGYAYDQDTLFKEAHRVLRSGGRLYVKDVFSRAGGLGYDEVRELQRFDEIYAYQTRTLGDTVKSVLAAGFHAITTADLKHHVDASLFYRSMFDRRGQKPQLNEFGRRHYWPFRCLPITFAEIRATK